MKRKSNVILNAFVNYKYYIGHYTRHGFSLKSRAFKRFLRIVNPLDRIKRRSSETGHMDGSGNHVRLELPGSEIPCREVLEGIHVLMPRSFSFPPVSRTNCLVVGDSGQNRIIVDPAPKDKQEYGKLVSALNGLKDGGQAGSFTDIFITHHHGDHHSFAPVLAREFSIPVMMSDYTFHRISKRLGSGYLKGIEIKTVRDGDTVTYWKGNRVVVYEIPGHDEGMLGLAPENMEWFLVGDLVESMRTVVIGGEEGDMAKYFNSLERIIALNPELVIPSHGPVLKTTEHLVRTLEHRRLREQAILELYRQGKTAEEMLRLMYRGINKRLLPLALENIKAHMKKLNLPYR